MSDDLPSVSVIIAARPDQSEIKAVAAARCLEYPKEQLEILVARGRQPSVQRNTAVRAARGELIYFLDDDSVPAVTNLLRAAAHFRDPKVQMVGGPNLCPPDAPHIEKVFGVVLSSWIAFGPSRARYVKTGKVRASGEKELILCNLMARRSALLDAGGFNEALYPNEENALMDALQKRGSTLLYDPDIFVLRRPRPSLRSFARMLRTYGRGRAEQFRLHPTFGSAPNFVPPLFVLYLLSLAAMVFAPGNFRDAAWKIIWAAPLAGYGLALLLQTIGSIPAHGMIRSLFALPLLLLSHVFYGIGFWRGLFTDLKRDAADRPQVPVMLETVAR
ncbi:MAG TPA: glycosyltransferase family 2 protein [Verrucomicrobiae bacterium]|nr:glycosyltransferase family 2 protein [Verrucomicrobiae bacterium]